jgi:hypothetical protein
MLVEVAKYAKDRAQVNKITGMLIDYTIFEELDIIITLSDPAATREWVLEAESKLNPKTAFV